MASYSRTDRLDAKSDGLQRTEVPGPAVALPLNRPPAHLTEQVFDRRSAVECHRRLAARQVLVIFCVQLANESGRIVD